MKTIALMFLIAMVIGCTASITKPTEEQRKQLTAVLYAQLPRVLPGLGVTTFSILGQKCSVSEQRCLVDLGVLKVNGKLAHTAVMGLDLKQLGESSTSCTVLYERVKHRYVLIDGRWRPDPGETDGK